MILFFFLPPDFWNLGSDSCITADELPLTFYFQSVKALILIGGDSQPGSLRSGKCTHLIQVVDLEGIKWT